MLNTKPIDQLLQCPKRHKHTKCPDDYVAWHIWSERKMKTHRQVRCPGCHLWVIWVPKLKTVPKVNE